MTKEWETLDEAASIVSYARNAGDDYAWEKCNHVLNYLNDRQCDLATLIVSIVSKCREVWR